MDLVEGAGCGFGEAITPSEGPGAPADGPGTSFSLPGPPGPHRYVAVAWGDRSLP